MASPYDTDLDRNPANFQPLRPLSFLARAAAVYPDQTAVIHGVRTWTYREFYARTRRLASALTRRGIKRGDTVAVVLANTPTMLEAHYGVAMAGGVLNTINTRLDAAIVAFTLDHGEAKGVVYHHRGASLLAMANVITCGMGKHPVYLWTLPMFHCNGWCFTWTLSVVAGTHVCLRAVRAPAMYDAIVAHKVTHLCGAPIVMSTLLNAPAHEKKPLPHVVQFATAAAPPPEAVLAAMKAAGFNVTHLYGLTETYGPAAINDWHREWEALNSSDQAAKKARQGVAYPVLESLDVIDPQTMKTVPRDGETLGEVMFRGNVVMKGYLKNKSASEAAF